MALRLVSLRFDAHDPDGLAAFWAEALGWDVGVARGGEVSVVPTDGTPFRLDLVPVAEPKVGKNRIHLDLTTTSLDDQEETVARLLELGASPVDVGQGPDDDHVVLADPEGNELCIIEPGNSFLAGCGRLGSITCDGTPAAGRFWSEALGWPLVWDQDEETAIRASDGTGPFITWGPPVPPKVGRNRLQLEVAPAEPADHGAEVDRLLALGATTGDLGQGAAGETVLRDPDGNELSVRRSR